MLQYFGEDKGGHDAVRDGAIQRRCGGTHVFIGQRRLRALQRMVRGAVAWHEEGRGGGCIKRWGCLKRGVTCRGGLHEQGGRMKRGGGGLLEAVVVKHVHDESSGSKRSI